jgi:hypothetical protein
LYEDGMEKYKKWILPALIPGLFMLGFFTGYYRGGYGHNGTFDERLAEEGRGAVEEIRDAQQRALTGVESVQGTIGEAAAGIDRSLERAGRAEGRIGNAADIGAELVGRIERGIGAAEECGERLEELGAIIYELNRRAEGGKGQGE